MASSALNGQGTAQLEAAFLTVEGDISAISSGTGFPAIEKMSTGTVDLTDLATTVMDLDVTGADFLQGQTVATLSYGAGSAGMVFTALRPGTPGNAITVEIVDSAAGNLDITVTGTAIVIDKGGATDDAATIVAALNNADPATSDGANLLVDVVVLTDGASAPPVTAEDSLEGGLGTGIELLVNGTDQAVDTAVTETAISGRILTAAAIGSPADGEVLGVQVRSNGRISGQAQLCVAT